MHTLNSNFNVVIRKFSAANGNLVDSLARAIPILSIILTLFITLSPIISGMSSSEDPDDGSNPPIVLPVENTQMRLDLLQAINVHRPQHGAVPAEFDAELYASAQRKANQNAASGGFDIAAFDTTNIVLLQARQDSSIASVDNFMEMWMSDYHNFQALMDPDNHSIGIGVAMAEGKTYAVVQFTRQ